MADIKLVNIEKHFGPLYVIRKLNLEVKDREFLVLLGPSGCGKTTTLRAIAGLEEVEAGDILIDGKPVQHLHARDRDIAFVFQLFALYPHLTAFENIAFPLKAIKESKINIEKRVKEVAKVLQIEHLLRKRPSALSGGDMQRVAVGRAMVRRPKAFLMDEPIGSLDAKLREGMRTELKRLHIEISATTLYVTHDQVEAMSMADRIAIMNDGILQQVGSPEEVYNDPANLFVAQFIGSPIMNILDCSVGFDENNTKILLGQDEFTLQFSKPLYSKIKEKGVPNGQLALGVRPEAVLVERNAKDTHQMAKVHVIEPIGPYDIVDIKVGDQIIRGRTPTRFVENVGDTVWIRLDEHRTHFFDKRSGDSLNI
ncbi:MAG: ATP-binding cassette domain-containing protein [candidate division Zixibacteria bacterium]|nr:ATP-binding cassette domain-containing protein [candidate division Zixibacteria bacterium]